MPIRVRLIACMATVCAAAYAADQAAPIAPSTSPPSLTTLPASQLTPQLAAHVRELIEQLDSADFDTRHHASIQVNSLPGSALEIVQSAIASGDLSPEASERLRRAVKYLAPRSRHEQQTNACRRWESELLHQTCAKAAHLDHLLDRQVDQAIDLFLKLGRDPFHGPVVPRLETLQALNHVLENADDPEPLLACLRQIVSDQRTTVEDLPGNHVAERMVAEKYAPGAEMIVLLDFLWGSVRPADTDLRRAITLLPEVAESPDLPAGELDQLANSFYEVCRRDQDYTGPIIDAFLKVYAAARPDAAGPKVLHGLQMLDSGLAQLDADDSARAQADLQVAEDEFHSAFAIDPNDSRIGVLMLIKLRASDGSEEDVDKWYLQAITADPDNWQAPSRKLDLLWRRGDTLGMLRLGRECLATENWRGQFPLILAQAHGLISLHTPDIYAYLRQPEVWKDVRAIYEGGLANFPDSLTLRSKYAYSACVSEQWDTADEQFSRAAGHYDLAVFGSSELHDYLQRKAHRLATQSRLTPAASQPTTGPAPQ